MKQFLAAQEYAKNGWSMSLLRRRLAEEKIRVVFKEDALYPQLLREIDQPPPLLFVQGNSDLLGEIGERPSVAVVGTRRNTSYGKLVTTKIVEELVSQNAIIVSGGMYGIDSIAHQAALNQNGKTIAVLGSGVAAQGAYWQQLLSQQIIEADGAVISEFFPWQQARKGFFPRRNRIVAGLSQVVVVTEAARKSGSLITAQFGLDFGREVCAVPGAITNRYANGTTWLINQGASLVTSGQDVLKQVDFEADWGTTEYNRQTKQPIVTLVQNEMGITTEKVAEILRCSVTKALQQLSELEMQNRLISQGQQWFLVT
jgi:DNA processing protein